MDDDSIGDRMFTNEDLSRPENRINTAMFGLMTQDWFQHWLLSALNMPRSAVVFPPKNVGPVRPDFTIADPANGETLGWIEVEIGTDAGQQRRYEERFDELRTIWGRDDDGGDLSLERIEERLNTELDDGSLEPQARLNVLLLRQLITTALTGIPAASKPVPVSSAMRDTGYSAHWPTAWGSDWTSNSTRRFPDTSRPMPEATGACRFGCSRESQKRSGRYRDFTSGEAGMRFGSRAASVWRRISPTPETRLAHGAI